MSNFTNQCQNSCQILIGELNCSSFNGTCILPACIPEDKFNFHSDYRWWMEGAGSMMICLVGLLFNLTTIIVVLGSELAANFFNWILVFLAIFDNLFLLNRISESFRCSGGFPKPQSTCCFEGGG